MALTVSGAFTTSASDALSISGSNTSLAIDGTSTLAGTLTMNNGAALTASGSGVTVLDTGTTTIVGSNLYAQSGATLRLPGFTSFTAPSGYGDWTWSATGANSHLDLPNLGSIGNLAFNTMRISASQGGDVSLPALTSIDNSRPVLFTSDGSGSTLDVSALPSFAGYGYYSSITVSKRRHVPGRP